MCAMARDRRGARLGAGWEAFSDLPSHAECVFAGARLHLNYAGGDCLQRPSPLLVAPSVSAERADLHQQGVGMFEASQSRVSPGSHDV
jgi:hypothetical protein